MYTLIGNPKNRSFRVVWMLEELGVDYEIDLADPRSEKMVQANPSGKAPALKLGDDIIIDSAAIIQFLADKHRRFTFEARTLARARQDSFTCFVLDEVDGTLWNVAKDKFILPEPLRAEGVRAAAEHEFAKTISNLERRLGDKDYLMGSEMTVPDILLGHCIGWAINAKFGWPNAALGDYASRLMARPAYRKAHEIRSR